MSSILYDMQEIFFLIYSPCWTVLLALFVVAGVMLAAQRALTAIWRQRRGVLSPDDSDTSGGS
jgi:hypothetical protein